MRTLFITFTYLKGNRGGIYASRTHINLFAELSDSMTLLYPYKKGMEPEGICEDKINMVPVYDRRSKARKMADLMAGIQTRFYYIDKSYIDKSKYDIVIFDSSQTSSRLINKFKRAGFKIVTIHHNYQIEFLKGDQKGFAKWPNIFWTYISEGKAIRCSDLNLTLTIDDIELFKKHYSKDAPYEVLGVYDYQHREKATIQEHPSHKRFVITGGLGAKQNEDSLLPWIENYYPLLRKEYPDSSLTMAGRAPSNRLIESANRSNVKVIASPPDMAPILEESDFYICPTDRGGGLKLRILDGLKFGLQVLTHKVSARGYEKLVEAGIVFPYDDKESFVNQLRNMVSKTSSRKEILEKYNSIYSFENGVRVLNEILKTYNLK